MKGADRKELLGTPRRVVVKIGTNALALPDGTGLDPARIDALAEDAVRAMERGVELVIVTSGAVGAGMAELGLSSRPAELRFEQACAAVGQCRLMEHYMRAFGARGRKVAQILLTQADLRDRQRYLNFSNTVSALLEMGAVPIINENDTVAVDELHYGARFGDNDELSAHVTIAVDADLLVILTDTEGLYTADPRRDKQARLINVAVVSEVERIAVTGGPGTRVAKGGMASKVQAARKVGDSGRLAVIAGARRPGGPCVLCAILDGEEVGTLLLPSGRRLRKRKHWIRHTLHPRGTLVVDAGAARAVGERGKSLLPSGVRRVEGRFSRGDSVRIVDEEGREVARGLVNYSSEEVEAIKGLQSSEIKRVLGHCPHEEVVHRDNLCTTE